MFLFLAGLFPLALIFYFLHKASRNLPSLKACVSGAVCGIISCIYTGFFALSPDLTSAAFLPNFFAVFFLHIVLPVAVPFFLCAFFSRSPYPQALKLGLSHVFPLTASFYAFFIPMLVIASPSRSIYEIFALPALYLLFLYTLSWCAKIIVKYTNDTSTATVPQLIILLLLCAICLSASQTFRLIDAKLFRYALCAALFIFFTIVLLVICKTHDDIE
ncbi:MAG: hypothetical protein Ta2A_20580 [Treponemataceae bacterium]|nr:MAG: hypothetical protein Ta2A_20580 [Treponemataceae bacterium]